LLHCASHSLTVEHTRLLAPKLERSADSCALRTGDRVHNAAVFVAVHLASLVRFGCLSITRMHFCWNECSVKLVKHWILCYRMATEHKDNQVGKCKVQRCSSAATLKHVCSMEGCNKAVHCHCYKHLILKKADGTFLPELESSDVACTKVVATS